MPRSVAIRSSCGVMRRKCATAGAGGTTIAPILDDDVEVELDDEEGDLEWREASFSMLALDWRSEQTPTMIWAFWPRKKARARTLSLQRRTAHLLCLLFRPRLIVVVWAPTLWQEKVRALLTPELTRLLLGEEVQFCRSAPRLLAIFYPEAFALTLVFLARALNRRSGWRRHGLITRGAWQTVSVYARTRNRGAWAHKKRASKTSALP